VPGPRRVDPPEPADYPSLARAVEAVVRRHGRVTDPLERARALSALLEALGEQVNTVTAERDAALIELFQSGEYPSHRALSTDLGLSRQRVDQLARHGRAGGRPRRADAATVESRFGRLREPAGCRRASRPGAGGDGRHPLG
jgi:hypothetical protein